MSFLEALFIVWLITLPVTVLSLLYDALKGLQSRAIMPRVKGSITGWWLAAVAGFVAAYLPVALFDATAIPVWAICISGVMLAGVALALFARATEFPDDSVLFEDSESTRDLGISRAGLWGGLVFGGVAAFCVKVFPSDPTGQASGGAVIIAGLLTGVFALVAGIMRQVQRKRL